MHVHDNNRCGLLLTLNNHAFLKDTTGNPWLHQLTLIMVRIMYYVNYYKTLKHTCTLISRIPSPQHVHITRPSGEA